MKVLFCTNAFEHVTNGPAKFASLLLNESVQIPGFEIRILTEDVRLNENKIYKLKLYNPRLLKPMGQLLRMFQYHHKAINIRKEFHFDVLVYNNALVGLLSSFLFSNTIGMINDYTVASFHTDNLGTEHEPKLKKWFYYNIERIFCRHTKQVIIVNSEFLACTLSREYKVPIAKFKILHKGIENHLIKLDRELLVRNKIPRSILFGKTNFRLAGFWDMAKALKILDRDVNLTVVGPSKIYHNKIKSFFSNSKINLKVYEYLPQGKIFELLASHKVFCLPAYKEAFGVSILEALASGCIVVTTDVGGIPEAIKNNSFAFLIKHSDPEGLATALDLALEKTDYGARIFDLNNHLKQFSSENVINNFSKILQKTFPEK